MRKIINIVLICLVGLFLYLNYTLLFKDDSLQVSVEKTFQIQAAPYDVSVNIIITKDTAKALAYVQLNTDSTITIEDFRDAEAVTFKGYGTPSIWFPSLTRSTNDLSKANHELMHVLYYITNRAGLTLDESTDEAYAYELDYLTLQLFKHIR